jgi:GTP-binding protein
MIQDFQTCTYVGTVTDARELPPIPAEVAFVGRSNVGKSSVINALCHQKNLARTSQTPGRTRTINVFAIGRKGWLVDLPGYGYAVGPAASREGWQAMIEGYLTGRPSLRRVFLIVDAKVGPTALDLQMARYLRSQRLPFRVLANKADRVKSSMAAAQKKNIARGMQVPETDLSWISASGNLGIPALRSDIAAILAGAT